MMDMDYRVLYSDFDRKDKISSEGLSGGRYLFVKDEDSFSQEPMNFKMSETEDGTKKKLIEAAGDFPIFSEDYLLVVDSRDTTMEVNVVQVNFDMERIEGLNRLPGINFDKSQIPAFRARRYGCISTKYTFFGDTCFPWKELKRAFPQGKSFAMKFKSDFYDVTVPDGRDIVSGNNRYAIVDVEGEHERRL